MRSIHVFGVFKAVNPRLKYKPCASLVERAMRLRPRGSHSSRIPAMGLANAVTANCWVNGDMAEPGKHDTVGDYARVGDLPVGHGLVHPEVA